MRRLNLRVQNLVETDSADDGLDLPETLLTPAVVRIRKPSRPVAAVSIAACKIQIPSVRFYETDEELDNLIAAGASDLDPGQLANLFNRKGRQLRRYGQQFARRHARPPSKDEKRAFGLFKDFYRALGNPAVQPYAEQEFKAMAAGLTPALLSMAIRALRAPRCQPQIAEIALPLLYQHGPAALMLDQQQILLTLDFLLRGPEANEAGPIPRQPDQVSYAALKALPAMALSLYGRAHEVQAGAGAPPGLLLWYLDQFIPANDRPRHEFAADPFAQAAAQARCNTRGKMSVALGTARVLHARLDRDRKNLKKRYRAGGRSYAALPGSPEYKLQSDLDQRRGYLADLRAQVEAAFTAQPPRAVPPAARPTAPHRRRSLPAQPG